MLERKWQLQEAKARFSEVVDRALEEGPQVVTRRGAEAAVVVAIGTWRELEKRAGEKRSIKDWLLAPGARTETLVPSRKARRSRPLPNLD